MDVTERSGALKTRRYLFEQRNSLGFVAEVARGHGWTLPDEPPRLPPDHAGPVRVLLEILPGLRLLYENDPARPNSYVQAIGDSGLGPDIVDHMMAVFRAYPGILTFEALLDDLDAATETEARDVAVRRAGLGAPAQMDERLVARITECATAKDKRLREGALCAIGYTEWPVFLPLVRKMAAEDRKRSLRAAAKLTLKAYELVGLTDSR
ncbi:hypothetical protein GCM10023196_039330 [Actinoallomurus vinaceus]|uniref:HEAT repeat domain-containing protein n=1 Tax=Actinoallomurus vinaceus TaxID=1080074 RepID=A0ABP8UD64_9ACTN